MPTNKKPDPFAHAVPAAIERFRAIAGPSASARPIAESPRHPDAQLLEHGAAALHYMKLSAEYWGQYHALPMQDRHVCPDLRRVADSLTAAAEEHATQGAHMARKMAKLPAATGAGIYAKAIVCRASRTGAAALAKSLADDLIANGTLRAALWPAEGCAP